MITIRDILNNNKFSKLQLINPDANLDRKVSTIESTETPDIVSYLSPNAFLLTTAMVYKDNQVDLANLIKELNKLPCAGLGIKLGRFIDELEPIVLETANSLNFPLIQIPIDMTLGNIFNKLLSHIWSDQNEELLYSLNIQRQFSNLMIRNASLDVLIRNLSHTIKLPIALVDPFGNIISTSSNAKTRKYKRVLREIVEFLSTENTYHEDFPMVTSNTSIYPINMAGYYPYYLIIFDIKNIAYPVSNMAIEQAILILAFTLYKNLRISFSTLSSKEELFKIIASYESFDEKQIVFSGRKYGLIPSTYYQVIVCSISNKDRFLNNIPVMEEWYTLVYNWLDEKLAKDIDKYILLPDRENYDYIILLQKPSDNLIERFISYREVLQNTLRLDMNFFMGQIVHDIKSIKNSYMDAIDAIDFGTVKDNLEFIKYNDQLDTLALLNMLPKSRIDGFVLNTLKSLAYPKDEHIWDLRNTLKVFLDLNCSITDTANTLFIHRNTVKYRIEKCIEILGQNVTDPSYSLKLRLALTYIKDSTK